MWLTPIKGLPVAAASAPADDAATERQPNILHQSHRRQSKGIRLFAGPIDSRRTPDLA
jgi:hypothetical protein